MLLKNTWAILALGFLLGIATNLGLIGSQSYLLSCADAVYTIYGSIAAGLLFSVFLRYFHLIKLKYAHFSAVSLLVFSCCLLVLTQNWLSGLPKAIMWFLAAMFGFDLLRWIVSELTIRYLDPARANSYFSYLNACFEGGTVLVVLFLKFYGRVLDPNQTLQVILVCCLASLVLIAVQFLPRRNFEIVYSESSADQLSTDGSRLKPLLLFFVIMTLGFAAIEVSEDYLVKIVVKDRLQSYEAIRSMTDNYFSTSCALIVLLSFFTGKAIESKRVSPIRLLGGYAALMAAFSALCFATGYFYLFIAFEVIRRVSEYCLYSPSYQMIMGSFVSHLRPKIKAMHSFYYYVLIPVAMAGVFSLTNHLNIKAETTVVLGLILLSSLTALAALYKFKVRFTSTLYDFIDSGSKAAAIIAAHTLSYIRPKDYVERMSQVLARAPKKLLRKTIVLGLAYANTDDSVEIIEHEFFSDKEEIQLAALDALRVSKKLRATQFMLNILLERARPKTQRVRLNAMAAIGALYGKKAIPFLLNGLDDEDPRTVANALEVLSFFKERELKQVFIRFAESDVPRIKANALLGLSRYRDTRKLFNKIIRQSLTRQDVPLITSLLYIIGKTKASEFRGEVRRIFNNTHLRYDERVINPLTWALTRLNEKSGFDLANEILTVAGSSQINSFMHFFSQHDPETRYDIIEHYVNVYSGDIEAIRRVGEILKHSVYDFHEELQYLKVYSQSVPASLRSVPASAV